MNDLLDKENKTMTTRKQKNIRFKQAQQRAIEQQQATDELIKLSSLADKVATMEIINSTKDMPDLVK